MNIARGRGNASISAQAREASAVVADGEYRQSRQGGPEAMEANAVQAGEHQRIGNGDGCRRLKRQHSKHGFDE
jgi:hypothetical protein